VNFGFTDEQDMLRETARAALAETFPAGHARRLLEGTQAPRTPWERLARLGWFGVGVEESRGGSGGGFVDQVVILEEMGRVLAPADYAATVCGAVPVLDALACGAQRGSWLDPLLRGARIGVLLAGPDGSGVTATPRPEGLSLTGAAGPVGGGAGATTFVVAAEIDGDGVAVCCVDAGAHGVTRAAVAGTDATARLGRVTFDGTVVPAHAILGEGAEAARAVGAAVDRLAVAACAELCGAAERMLETAVEHAKAREQFGRPIGSFQAIKHMCADMLVRLAASRAAVHYAALCIAEGRDDVARAVSGAKAFASESLVLLAEDALQVHGGIGFTWEHDIHLYVRRAASTARLHGSGDAHRERVAAAILAK
jgi:alkylation response protein AidB-like acyl-CoA dehydrogenase